MVIPGVVTPRERMQQAIPLAKRRLQDTRPPPALNTGDATVRAPAAACTRTPWPNARSMRTDTQPPHLRRAMSPASSHSPPSSVSSTGLVKTPSTRSAPATMAALRITRHTAHCLTGWRHRKQRDARLRPNFVYHRRREQGLSPRPALPTTSPPPTRTGRKCIGPDAERARSCAPQINHDACSHDARLVQLHARPAPVAFRALYRKESADNGGTESGASRGP